LSIKEETTTLTDESVIARPGKEVVGVEVVVIVVEVVVSRYDDTGRQEL